MTDENTKVISDNEYEELISYRRKTVLDALELNEKTRKTVEQELALYTETEAMENHAKRVVQRLGEDAKKKEPADPVSKGNGRVKMPKQKGSDDYEEGRSLAQKIVNRKRRGENGR